MHTDITRRTALRRGVTTSAVGVTMAFLMAGQADAAEDHQVVEVAPGDTLTEIAADHGLSSHEGWRQIAAATPDLADPDMIVPGQQVRVPTDGGASAVQQSSGSGSVEASQGSAEAAPEEPAPEQAAPTPESGTAVVQAGDTLAEIAAAHGVGDWRRIFDANPHVADPHLLGVGQELRIPAAGEELERRPLPQAEPAPNAGDASTQQVDASQRSTVSEDPTPQQQVGSSSTGTEAPQQSEPSAAGGGVWDRLAQCESNGNWSANTGNGFYGGLQFTPSSWRAVGGQGLPHQASKAEQISRAQQLQAQQGWGAWPACSRKLGLR